MDWWKDAETFHASTFANDWGQNGHFDWGTLAQSKFTFTTHCPIDRNFIDRCHKIGVRCFPYVSFYFGPYQAQFGPISSNTYEGVNFSQHPDFIERDQYQNPKPWAFKPTTPDGVGMTFPNPPDPSNPPSISPFLTCPNYAPYQQKMLDWVDYIMQQGADGIFVDNLLKRTHCYAPHAHIYQPLNPTDPNLAQNQAFALLLTRVREVVKRHRPDGLIIGNSGDPLGLLPGQSWPDFQQSLDADTLEGYVCSGSRAPTWQNGFSWDKLGQQLQSYLAQGKQILAISSLIGREDAFLCYCAARLAGLTWCGVSMSPLDFADLHRIRLGKALGPEGTDPTKQVNYRVFEHGIVAVNWNANTGSFPGQTAAASALAVTSQSLQFFYDLFTPGNTPVDMNATSGLLSVPPQSGRVFLFGSSTDYALNRLSVSAIAHPSVPQPPIHPPTHPSSGPPHTMS